MGASSTGAHFFSGCFVEPRRLRAVVPESRPDEGGQDRAMNVDWASFSAWPALAGGLHFRLAVPLVALAHRRVGGISRPVGWLERPSRPAGIWRARSRSAPSDLQSQFGVR